MFTMANESTMVNSKKKSDIVLLFNIAMHVPIIYLSYHNVVCVTCIGFNMDMNYL